MSFLLNLKALAIFYQLEEKYENGTVFRVGNKKIVYLFKYKKVHYGVDILMYKIRPKTFILFDIDKLQIIEILPLEKYIKIVEFLVQNQAQPFKEITALYDELREAVYN